MEDGEEHNRELLHRATVTIVNRFMESHLREKGCTWQPSQTLTPPQQQQNPDDQRTQQNAPLNTDYSSSSYDRKLSRILESLDVTAKKLQATNGNNEKIRRTVSLLDDIHPEEAREQFNFILDELFAGGIIWSHIVTLLVFGQELAYNRIENENEDMVDHITKWMSSYINLKLSDWIINQGGWESIRIYASTLPDGDSNDQDNNGQDSNKSLSIFLGLSATVALLGIAVLCTKLHY